MSPNTSTQWRLSLPAACLALTLGAFGVAIEDARAFPVDFDPGSYTGRYSVPSVGFVTGPVSGVDLAPGTYSVDNGSSIGGSAFQFDVDSSGQVTSLNPAAAQGVGNTLVFNTTNVVIDPAGYTGRYFPSSHRPAAFTGVQSLSLIPALSYTLDNGSSIGGSAFQFDVDSSGQVTSLNPAAAQGVGNTLVFECLLVAVDPQTFAGSYNVSNDIFSGAADAPVIPSLVTRLSIAGGGDESFTADLASVTPPNLVLGDSLGDSHTFLLSPNGSCAALVCTDEDGDGYGSPGGNPTCPAGDAEDCDDTNAAVNPGAIELPGNGSDENCDGSLGACDPFAEWRNHGQFVRCVAQEVNDLRAAGLIGDSEGDDLVSSAAQSDVGK